MGLSIVILAAGEGRRMKTDKPKPLVNLADLPLVQYPLNTAKALKPERIVLVTGYKKDEVKKYVLEIMQVILFFANKKRGLVPGMPLNKQHPICPIQGKL